MSIWTKDELRELAIALKDNDHKKITHLMNIGQQRIELPVLKNSHHILLAASLGIVGLFEYYLKTQKFDNNTLFNCLEAAIASGELPIVQAIFESQYINFYPNYVLPQNKSIFANDDATQLECTILTAILTYANLKEGYDEFLKYIVKKVNVNYSFRYGPIPNNNALRIAISRNMKPALIKLLLDNGADPYQKVTSDSIDLDIIHYLYANAKYNWVSISHASEYVGILKEWKESREKAKDTLNKNNSSEHSSGSNSPMSLDSGNNSPTGTPPKSSAIVRHSPPDSPVVSRNGSPPGSPVHISDNSSSGSAGSSPEKVAAIKLTPQQKAAELLKANNNDPDEALLKAMSKEEKENDLEVQKILLDSGVTFKEVKGMSVLYYAVACGRLELVKYMFFKFPNLNKDIRTKSGKTILHGAFSEKGSLEIMRYVLSKGCDPNATDNNGLTPLHCVSIETTPLIEEFVQNGANPLLTNHKGQTPLKWHEVKYNDMRSDERVIKLLTLLKRVTEEAQRKQQVKTQPIQPAVRPSIVSIPSEIQYRSPVSRPLLDDRLSYGNSSSVMFQKQNPPANNAAITPPVAVPSPVQRAEPKQVGAPLFVTAPDSSAKLPKSDKKSDKKDNSVEKRSVVDKLKSALRL